MYLGVKTERRQHKDKSVPMIWPMKGEWSLSEGKKGKQRGREEKRGHEG